MLMEHHVLSGTPITIGGGAALRVRRAEDCARFSLRIAAEHAGKAAKAFGCDLPAKIGEIATSGGKLALCLSPDEWLLLTPSQQGDDIVSRFAALYDATPHSLVDIGHRETGIEVEGPAAITALSAACALDLTEMADGTGTRTIFDKAQVVLIRTSGQSFRIEVWCSFASHVWGLLEAASHEIELGL